MDHTAVEDYLTRIRAAKDAEMRPCTLVTPAFISTPGHRVGIAHLFLRPRFLLADPTGTGKTPQALVAWAYLKEKDPKLKALVVTTMSAQFQWQRAVHKFLLNTQAQVYGYNKFRKLPISFRQPHFLNHSTTDVWMTTYAMLAKDEAFLLQHLDNFVLILDEGHALKSHKGEVLYPAAFRFAQKARACWALTATPMKNGRLNELYSVLQVVRPGTFPAQYNQFRKTYFVLRLVRPRWKGKNGLPAKPFYEEVGTQNLDHLQAVIRPFYLQRPADELTTGLPPLLPVEVDVMLSKPQRDLYVSCLTEGRDNPKRRLAALTAAQQALDCPAVLGHPGMANAKWEELKRRLTGDNAGEKVLIYTKFSMVADWLSGQLAGLAIQHGKITGQTPLRQRDLVVHRFQNEPGFDVIVLTDAGGEALDLQAARIVVFYDLPWSWGSFKQVLGRMIRQGSVHANVIAELLVAHPNTIDELVIRTLLHKEQSIQQVLTTSPSLLSLLQLSEQEQSQLQIPIPEQLLRQVYEEPSD